MGLAGETMCNVAFVVRGLVYSTEQCTGNNLGIVHNNRTEPVYTSLECVKYTKIQTGFLTHSSW